MEPEGSLPSSQESATGPSPVPDSSSPHLPHTISLIFNLILSFHLCLYLSSGLLTSSFPIKIFVCISHLSVRATFCYHLTLLDLITLIIYVGANKLWSSSLCSLLHPPVTSSHRGQNIPFSALFWNTLNLCCFCSMRYQVSHPYKAAGIIIV